MLNNKIENEINKINNIYEKTMEELKKSYILKYGKLIKEENELKEKLQIKVTKSKEKLEYYLTESINNLKLNEIINKRINKLVNEKNNNIIKILSWNI